MNLDTLYSSGVFDLAAADVTIELPPTNGRYMSLMAIDEEQYALGEVIYPHVSSPKSATFFYCQTQSSCTPESHTTHNPTSNSSSTSLLSLTRYVRLIIRILADPLDPEDLARAHSLQDKINVAQQHKGELVTQNWDRKSHLELRALLISLAPFIAPGTVIFGTRQEVDPLGHLIGTAAYWGGLPVRDSVYEAHYPSDSDTIDSGTIYTITVMGDEVPIYMPGFWSVTVYNSNGYLEYNEWGSYSENSLSALPNDTYNATNGGKYVIYFSMVRADYMKNWILIFPGWNYIVRLYHPLEIVFNGQWKFPPLVEIVSPGASTAFKIDTSASFWLVVIFMSIIMKEFY
jgi:hypothetical protein